jgi:hypothetical protein
MDVAMRFERARQQTAGHAFCLMMAVERFAQAWTSLRQLVEKFWQQLRWRTFGQMVSPERPIVADEAILFFWVQEVEYFRRPNELGEQFRQQSTEQLVVLVLYRSGLHISGDGDKASGIARQIAQQNLQGRVPDVRRVAGIARGGIEQGSKRHRIGVASSANGGP